MAKKNLKKAFLIKERLKEDIDLQIIQKKFLISFSWKIIHLLKFTKINVHKKKVVYLVMHMERKIMFNN